MYTNLKDIEKTFILMELQRKRTSAKRLQQRLESYLCVPKTPDHFEKKENLKFELQSFTTDTEKLVSELQLHDIQVMNYIENVERRFKEFSELRQEVEEYVQSAR